MLGQTDVALGNVVGSNIANIGLILGLSAIIRPLQIDNKLVGLDIPLMIAAAVLMLLFLANQRISQTEGIILLTGVLAFTVLNFYLARRAPTEDIQEFEQSLHGQPDRLWKDILFIIGGIALLTLGARWMVDSAITIARFWGLSEAVIGLTIVAVGTSLPELATSILAAAKRMGDISVGNIVGSNIFNILAVLGATAVTTPIPMGNVSWVDLFIMLAFIVIVLPMAWTAYTLRRWEGAALFVAYCSYSAWLVTSA